jgi:hypothetical protein
MDQLQTRLEVLERQMCLMNRRLRWWRGLAGGLLVLAVLTWALPLSTAQEGARSGEQGLAQRVAALEDLLKHFSRKGNEVFITGANLHLVNGLGSTDCGPEDDPIPDCPNGLGNLIVGYNEPRDPILGETIRTGSHNVVVGQFHNFSRFGGIVVGNSNTISGDFAVVSGGQDNTASGLAAAVSGGAGNTASFLFSSVSGGQQNTASGERSWVSGGFGNTASGAFASVSGGSDNTASGVVAAVSGGFQNTASGFVAAVSGGRENMASGGDPETGTGGAAAVSGGFQNAASGDFASVSGGRNRTAEGEFDWVAGSLFEDE